MFERSSTAFLDPEKFFISQQCYVVEVERKILQMQISTFHLITEARLNLGLNRDPFQINFLNYGFFAKLHIVESYLVIDEHYVGPFEVFFVSKPAVFVLLHLKDCLDRLAFGRTIVSLDPRLPIRNALKYIPEILNFSLDFLRYGKELKGLCPD